MRPNISPPADLPCSIDSFSSSSPQTSRCQEMSRPGPSTKPSSVIRFHMISLAIAFSQLLAFCNWLQNAKTDAILQAVFSPVVFWEPAMADDMRSGCPINLTLEVVGDRWSLLVVRDMMFGNRRHFRELLTRSEEGISSNILADRLKTLLEQGIVTREDDPSHKQKGS